MFNGELRKHVTASYPKDVSSLERAPLSVYVSIHRDTEGERQREQISSEHAAHMKDGQYDCCYITCESTAAVSSSPFRDAKKDGIEVL